VLWFAVRARVEDRRSRLWTLRRADVEVRCETWLLAAGIEGRIVWDGTELYAFLSPGERELCAWAAEKRKELEADGWTQAD